MKKHSLNSIRNALAFTLAIALTSTAMAQKYSADEVNNCAVVLFASAVVASSMKQSPDGFFAASKIYENEADSLYGSKKISEENFARQTKELMAFKERSNSNEYATFLVKQHPRCLQILKQINSK